MDITTIKSQWRGSYQQARFRDAIFFVETDARQGGRRVALHQYPKRNVPYAEDMGRSASRFIVHGYLIGHWPYQGAPASADQSAKSYLIMKDKLVEALEKDGPGTLRLPMPYQKSDIDVMVASYSVQESRERGGICIVEMDFIEYGSPAYRDTVDGGQQVENASKTVEAATTGPITVDYANEAARYGDVYDGSTP
jgi:prophage DNA circulation protein